ncbi:MAG: polysaccharide deacetylase family protein [Ginsengibacter sp.]
MQNIKSKVDKSVLFLIEKLGPIINPLVLNFANEKNKLLIFYFHGIYESEAQKKLNHVDPQNNLTVSQFIEVIEYFLHHKYHFIKPEDLSEDLPDDKAYIMLTFDDGYFNNTLAIEILNRYKIPATFFITTKNVLENTSYWWDVIYKYRLKEGNSLEKIREEQVYLKSFKHPFIKSYISQNFGDKSHEPWSDIDRPLNTKELKEISLNPFVTIGNHTCNHSILTNYTRQEIKEELSQSNKTLFEITGIEPLTVAFPNGNFNNQVLEVTNELGFQFAFTIINKLNTLPAMAINIKLVCLNRFMAQPTNIEKYVSLNRLGYTPNSLYSSIKKSLLFSK